LFRNCETFATWAKTNRGFSSQSFAKIETILEVAVDAVAVSAILAAAFATLKYTGAVMLVRVWIAVRPNQPVQALDQDCYCLGFDQCRRCGHVRSVA
jgi:uncharacterized protein YidB (DUF937 family)